jgi:hypothetical protein
VIGSFDTIAAEANQVMPTPPPPVAISDGAMVSTGKTVLVWGSTSQGIFVQGDAPNGALEYQVQ